MTKEKGEVLTYEFSGTIKLIQDEQTFGGGFRKRGVVISVQDGKYEQQILLECHNDNIGLLNGLEPGQEVEASFNIRGREYNGQYFNNLVAWKINPLEATPGQAADNGLIPSSDKVEEKSRFSFDDEIPF